MCMGGSDTTRRWYWQFIRVIMEWCSSSIMQSWVKTIFMFSSSPPPFDGSSLVCQTELLLSAFYSFIYSHSRLSKVEHGLQQRGRGQKWARRRVGRDGKTHLKNFSVLTLQLSKEVRFREWRSELYLQPVHPPPQPLRPSSAHPPFGRNFLLGSSFRLGRICPNVLLRQNC